MTVADSITTLPGPTLTMTPYSGPNATGTPGIPVVMTNTGGGLFTVISVGVARPGSVKIQSSAGGVAVSPILQVRQ